MTKKPKPRAKPKPKSLIKAVSKRRLLKLAAFLEKLPRGRFNYTYWVGANWQGAPDLSCGTTACALGWACTIPEFRKLGLQLDWRTRTPTFTPARGRSRSYANAGSDFFRVSEDIAGCLFHPSNSLWAGDKEIVAPPATATAKEVAEHIRRVVGILESGTALT